MILLGTSGAVLGSLAAAALCDAALGRCDAPQVPGVLRTLGDAHPREAVSRQMNDGAVARNPHATDRPVARTGWINYAMGWQPGQPLAMQRVYQLHVLHTGRPAVAAQQVGLTSPRCRCRHQHLDVFSVVVTPSCAVSAMRTSPGRWASPSVHRVLIRLLPTTTRCGVPDQWRRPSAMARRDGLSRVVSLIINQPVVNETPCGPSVHQALPSA